MSHVCIRRYSNNKLIYIANLFLGKHGLATNTKPLGGPRLSSKSTAITADHTLTMSQCGLLLCCTQDWLVIGRLVVKPMRSLVLDFEEHKMLVIRESVV